MARGGITKTLVQKARQALQAKGMYPSIDGVRVELGNTGSKSTISRYLKELDAAERPVIELRDRIGNALKASVESLLDQVMEEGSEALTVAQAKFDEQSRDLEEHNQRLEGELATLKRQFEAQQSALEAQTAALQVSETSLREELGRNAQLNQARDDLERRIQERDEQILSLEEKHTHARDALEHYRTAVKDQRDQEQRRHEGQVQQIQVELRQLQQTLMVKQDELTRLNRDNERLLGECRHQAKSAAAHEKAAVRLTGEIAVMKTAVAKADGAKEALQEQLGLSRAESKRLEDGLSHATAQLAEAKRLSEQYSAELILLRQTTDRSDAETSAKNKAPPNKTKGELD
ncbi:DNA-binding protein [Pseudomonas sp. Z4-20]|uniref:DNA-binding protein n=1 Tax=Pseudomonas sp. Z4-20 TaxID=2817414 RepID=UPI003DA7C170